VARAVLTFTAGSNGSASMTFSGTLADLNTALAGLALQPTANFNGGDTLTITTNDQGNTGAVAPSRIPTPSPSPWAP
jgi:hypothetical protein